MNTDDLVAFSALLIPVLVIILLVLLLFNIPKIVLYIKHRNVVRKIEVKDIVTTKSGKSGIVTYKDKEKVELKISGSKYAMYSLDSIHSVKKN